MQVKQSRRLLHYGRINERERTMFKFEVHEPEESCPLTQAHSHFKVEFSFLH